jgi:uncharacterized protein YycO
MKKLSALLIAIVLTTGVFAQAKPVPTKDSLTSQTPLLTLDDINELDALIKKKFTIEQLAAYQEVFNKMQALVQRRVADYQSKNPKK